MGPARPFMPHKHALNASTYFLPNSLKRFDDGKRCKHRCRSSRLR